MKDSSKKYINAVLLIGGVALLFFVARGQQVYTNKFEIRKLANPILPKTEISEPARYNIDKIKGVQPNEPRGEVTDLESVYKDYPKEQAGQNMVEAWAKINPEDKSKIMKGFDETITKSEEELRINPDDKTAKGKLVISRMLKELAANNFNYKFKGNKSGGK